MAMRNRHAMRSSLNKKYYQQISPSKQDTIRQSFQTNTMIRTSSSIRNNFKAALVCQKDEGKDNFDIKYLKNQNDKKEIASLTKIMTTIVALEFMEENKINAAEQFVHVSRQAVSIKGTSAELEQGDLISFWDLLFGIMLPSGNDAAFCIAEYIGAKLLLNQPNKSEREKTSKTDDTTLVNPYLAMRNRKLVLQETNRHKNMKNPNVQCFVNQMNKLAANLGMKKTRYQNPHGLTQKQNISTAYDQFLLVQYCLKNEQFKRIVGTKIYFSSVKLQNSIWTRQIIWENTNRLLYKGYKGVKTGNTQSAGFCLASWFCHKTHQLILIVLGCSSREERDNQIIKLTQDTIRESGI